MQGLWSMPTLYRYVAKKITNDYVAYSAFEVCERLKYWAIYHACFTSFLKLKGVSYNDQSDRVTIGNEYYTAFFKCRLLMNTSTLLAMRNTSVQMSRISLESLRLIFFQWVISRI